MKSIMRLYVNLLLVLWMGTGCVTAKPGAAIQRKVAGKTYVIVGASSGFGRGVAERLGSYKANVVLAARRTELLEEIAANIRKSGGKAWVVPMDISKPEDLERLTQTTLQQFSDIDVWINMAGVGAIGKFWDIPLADQARVVDVNHKGVLYGTHAALQQFRKQGYGTLINAGSVESENPLAYHAAYAGTKAAVLNMSMAIDQELRMEGLNRIKVVVIEPWGADTPFFQHAANYSGGTPRVPTLDPPGKVVNATIRKSIRPKREVAIGGKAWLGRTTHRLFPRLSENLSARVMRRYQFTTAPAAPHTAGAVHQPIAEGREVSGGNKARIKAENRRRREAN